MHVYLVTGVAFIIAISLLVSLVFGIRIDTLATILKWFFGALLILALFLLRRRSKRREEKRACMAEQIERYRER